jgi:NADP-dependent aldehyde dehydrogenase
VELLGTQLIGRTPSAEGGDTFAGVDPAAGAPLPPAYREATADEVDRAVCAAEDAFDAYRARTADERAAFLRAVAREIEALGDALLERARVETGLPAARLAGERARTVGQLALFAALVEEGSWVDARIDPALPGRAPAPRPDVRRMLVPLGPAVVFGASNFPLAFSVAGGDTASALAAGCPVVVKAHPAHPGTAELTARAVLRAAEATGMPDGVFSLLHGRRPETALRLVRHPLACAVGFTGSLRAGRALFDAAAARPAPIPVYAEMGSVNPVFLLPSAVERRGELLADGLAGSITLGTGQFCTNPGLVVARRTAALDRFLDRLGARVAGVAPGPMLYDGIRLAYDAGVDRLRAHPGVRVVAEAGPAAGGAAGRPVLFATDAGTLREHPRLQEEVFGPSSLMVVADAPEELLAVARALEGQLTATVHGSEDELRQHAPLLRALERRAGRLIVNGYPTGVEVGHAMQHGGPYPATTDARSTSVGSAAVLRWARPVAYQDFPQSALPPELRDANPRRLWRTVDGVRTRDDVPRAAVAEGPRTD